MSKALPLNIVILAAGKGTRLKSRLPKVCHKLGGISLLEHVIIVAKSLSPDNIYVVAGKGYDLVKSICDDQKVITVKQDEQLGTAHAVSSAMPHIKDKSNVLVLFGDVPLILPSTLKKLVDISSSGIRLISGVKGNPYGYGRIIRNSLKEICKIVEEKDASVTQKEIAEVFSGILYFQSDLFNKWYPKISNNNAQGEYYLPDLIKLVIDDGESIASVMVDNEYEMEGVNNREQLSTLERYYQRTRAKHYMSEGVSFCDSTRVDFRKDVSIGMDTIIDINVVLENVVIGKNVTIGPNCVITASKISDNVKILPSSVIDGAIIGEECVIGPFARIRPGTQLSARVKVGNFVEIKNSKVDAGSKISHLSYIGDATIEKFVNIGAATITCNYDGANKYQTIIKEGAFIGSGTELIAPITIGKNTTIGAGSTITKDAKDGTLVLSRTTQKTIINWQRPSKDKLK